MFHQHRVKVECALQHDAEKIKKISWTTGGRHITRPIRCSSSVCDYVTLMLNIVRTNLFQRREKKKYTETHWEQHIEFIHTLARFSLSLDNRICVASTALVRCEF